MAPMPRTEAPTCLDCGRQYPSELKLSTCPECGVPLEPRAVVWRPHRPWTGLIPFALLIVFAPLLIKLLVTIIVQRLPPHPTLVFCGLIGAGLIAWCAPRLRLLTDARRFVALTPAGIHARTSRGSTFVPWTEVATLTHPLGIPRVIARDAAVHELDWIFETDKQVREFREAVQAAREQFSPAGGIPPPWH